MDFNLDDLDSLQTEEIQANESQRSYIRQLVSTSSLDAESRNHYMICSDVNLTYDQAQALIEELKRVQMDNINLARQGKLKAVDFGKALKRLIGMSNT